MFRKYPAVAGTASICIGVLAARSFSLPYLFWLALSLLFLAAGASTLIRTRGTPGRSGLPAASILCFLACAAALRYDADTRIIADSHISRFATGEQTRVRLEVADEPRISRGRLLAVVHVRDIAVQTSTKAVTGDALLVVRPLRGGAPVPLLAYGDVVELTGAIEEPSGSRNPGEFSYRDYLALNDIHALITATTKESLRIVERGSPSWFYASVILPSRRFVTRVARDVIKGNEADFLTGILLGDRTDISTEIKQAFINTGTIHILAVSGSHVVLVVAIIYMFFGLLRLPERPKIIATMAGILYYMELTGSSPSVVRASLMGIVVLFGKLLERRGNVYNALGASAILLFLYDPKQMFDVGAQLSYSAVFSMAYFYPKLVLLIKKIPESLEEIKGVDYVLKLFAVSCAAQVGTIPFTAYYFGRVSLICFVANLLVVPLSGIVITVGFISVLAGTISLWLASFFSDVNNLVIVITLRFVLLAGSVPYATVATPVFGVRETIGYIVLVVLVFHGASPSVVRRAIIVLVAAADLLLVLPSAGVREEGRLRVLFIDVGQGDAILLLGPAGDAVLVDAGPRNPSHDAGAETIVPLLQRLGVKSLRAAILTHPHSDHEGGMPAVLNSFPTGMIAESGQREASDLYDAYARSRDGIPLRIVRAGDTLDVLEHCRVYVLHPVASWLDTDSADGYQDLNGTSVVLKVVYGRTAFMLPGDANLPVEDHLVATYGDLLRSTLYKAGHHGSRTSNGDTFLRAVRPSLAAIPVGRINTFGHPSKEALARIRFVGAGIARTDEEGALLYESDGTAVLRVAWER